MNKKLFTDLTGEDPIDVIGQDYQNTFDESNLCAYCDKESTYNGGPYEMNDEYACGDCYQNAVERAEWLYESAREEGFNE